MASDARVHQTTREVTVLAEDPSVRLYGNKPLLTKVRIPHEPLLPGPRSSRIEVIDYDSSTGHFYKPYRLYDPNKEDDHDPYDAVTDIDQVIGNPKFHAHQVFGVASATLFEFERALGRSLSWGFPGRSHQLKIFPHAFREANAFYSRSEEGLLFGYFGDPKKPSKTIFTCLSHDIVAHETTHAILDGLRSELTRPSSPDQAAFHEGFADIIALLSNLRSEALIQVALRTAKTPLYRNLSERIDIATALAAIKDQSILTGLASEMGQATGALRRGALRRSVELKPSTKLMETLTEPHERGEIIVAAMLNAFLEVWHARLSGKQKLAGKEGADPTVTDGGAARRPKVDAWRVAEEGAKAAQHLLTMAIRAIDYLPPVHVEFRDFLMAIITADIQTCPDDSTYGYRSLLLKAFAEFNIAPHSSAIQSGGSKGSYQPTKEGLIYGRGNSSSMRFDMEGMFRFVWENQKALALAEGVYTRVNSVRQVARVTPDGVIVHETVAEYYQITKKADRGDLEQLGIDVPDELRSSGATFLLVGGGTLIFDEFGWLKFHISNNFNSQRQATRLVHLAKMGQLNGLSPGARPFALNHMRAGGFHMQYKREG